MVWKQDPETYTLFDFSQTITGDTTLIAKWKEIPADVWNDFYDSATAGIDGNGATVSWLESYEGKDGVLKIEHNSGHKWMATNSLWSAVRSVDAYFQLTLQVFVVCNCMDEQVKKLLCSM